MRRVSLFISVSLLIYLLVIYILQVELTLWPLKTYQTPQQAGLPQFQELTVTATDGSIINFWYAEGNKDKEAILFFHGNAYDISVFAPATKPFIDKGYAVLIMEYRGFGKTKGTMHQQEAFQDAARVYDWLKQQNYPDIAVGGYSFGCAVAVGLTTLRPVSKLILTAPFASLSRIVSEKPLPFASFVLQDRYISEEFIKSYKNPLLIIHGKKDRLLPYHHGEILYKNAASADKKLVLLENETHKSVFFEQKNVPIILNWLQETH